LTLQATVRMIEQPAVVSRLESLVEDLDITVRHIRSVIFELQSARLPGRSLREAVLLLAADSARSLGFDPRVHLEGPIDSSIDDQLTDNVLAVLQELLSNVARHADASRVSVSLEVSDGELSVSVVDDGRGVTSGVTGGRGMDNIRVRAKRMGGEVEWRPHTGGGTVARLRVPLK
jgi:signal transduction histidine kinase